MSSFVLVCTLTPPLTKSLLSTSIPELPTKTTFSPLPCKHQTSHILPRKSFHHYAVPPFTADFLSSSNVQEPSDQWAAERDTLLHQIQNLEDRVQHLSSVSGGVNNVEGLLKDFYSLGTRIFELGPKNFIPTPSITRTLMGLAGKLQGLATSKGLVPIDPHPHPGRSSNEIDQLVQTVARLYWGETLNETPYYLAGNFAPVRQETPPTSELEITSGEIPESLNGMMLRNGPDPKFDPEQNYSWMDGDSMIHGIKFKDGKATYVSRYVETSRIIQEKDFGRAEFFKYGDLEGDYGVFAMFIQLLRSKLNILDMSYGFTNANTGLVYHSGRVMALEDFGKPHALSIRDNGDIKTIGINDYNGVLDHWFTPHPKKDPDTGEMFVFGSMYTEPYCIYNVISKDGVMGKSVPITVAGPTYMHDLGLTHNYVILMDLPYVFSLEKMAEKNEWVYSLDPTKKSRFGVLPRYATSEKEIKWFEFDIPFFIFHNANAWEDDNGNIVMYSCLMNPSTDPRTHLPYLAPVISRRRSKNDGQELTLPHMYKLTFDMSTGKAKMEMITDSCVDYPKINENYMGRPTRYMYTSEVNQDSKIPSIIKYDLSPLILGKKIETKLPFDEEIYGNEVVFVPKSDSPTSEDDGYLVTFVHNEKTKVSYAYVIDAETMKITATIKLPNRVPYGFHAIYVTEDELKAQITSI